MSHFPLGLPFWQRTVQQPASLVVATPQHDRAIHTEPLCNTEPLCCAVLEVILSTLDRDLIPAQPAESLLAAAAAAACHQQSGSSSTSSQQVSALLSAVGRYPAGYAPAAASSEELQEAFRVLQVRGCCR